MKKDIRVLNEVLIGSRCVKCGKVVSEIVSYEVSRKVGDIDCECVVKECDGLMIVVKLWKREVVVIRSEGEWRSE